MADVEAYSNYPFETPVIIKLPLRLRLLISVTIIYINLAIFAIRVQGPRPVVERLGQTHHQQPAATIPSMSSVARSLLPSKRRLKLDPSSKLYFPCELLYRNSDHYFLRVTGKLRFFWIIVVIIMTQLRNEKKFSFFFLSFFLGMLILDIGYCR